MTIELKIKENEEVLLSPVRKPSTDGKIMYQLVDDKIKSWMELELISNSFTIIGKDPRIIEKTEDIKVKLDQLVLYVIEFEQSGTENTGDNLIEEFRPYNPDEIKVHSKQFNVRLISDMIDNGDIDLTPDFQRNLVWDSHQKSRLIESILLRIPLPMFYFSEDDEGRITIVDGLQRLTTIKEFMDNKFALKGLQYLGDSCNGRYFSNKNKDGSSNGKKTIDVKYFRWFNMTQFSVNVIDPSSPPKVKYDIFRRINTGGKPLNNQEIRNCLAGKGLREALREMSDLTEFKAATDSSIKPTRMDDQEVALRFILFHRFIEKDGTIDEYNGYMDSSLDNLTEEFVRIKKEELEKYVQLFSNAMKNAEYLFGRKYAFRKITPKDIGPLTYKQLINKALFVTWAVLLANYEHKLIKDKNPEIALLVPLAEEIANDAQLKYYLSYGTNGRANLIYAFSSAKALIDTCLKH